MTKSCFLLFTTIVSCLAVWPCVAKEKRTSPNIVYILADDMGIGDVQAYNKEGKIPTPNIDRMAKEGMKFMDSHTNSSVCTPTRYGIMTGRYAWRTNLKKGVLGGHSKHLISPDRETVASFLQKKEYKTACVGKWHLGMDWANNAPKENKRITAKYVDITKEVKNGPLDVGFDYFYGISGSLPMSPHAYIKNRKVQGEIEYLDDKKLFEDRGFVHVKEVGWVAKDFVQDQVLTTLANKTCEFISENKDKPFFVYMPLNSPHSPIVPRDDFNGKSKLNLHGDFVMETDWVVGEVLNTLDELELAENTIVIFTTDNGTSPQAGVELMKKMGHFTSWKYRGVKGTTWEGGHRVPFVVRWPNEVKANTECYQTICTTDLLATCADLFHEKLDDNVGEDSQSFLPALKGEMIPGIENRLVVHHSDRGNFAVRKGQWKLILDDFGGSPRGKEDQNPIINKSDMLLIDLKNDEGATTNVYAKHPDVVEDLKQSLADVIVRDQSTPGVSQPTDLANPKLEWPQIEVVSEYINSIVSQ